MYLLATAFQTADGPVAAHAPGGLLLQGRAEAPARLVYRFRTRIRRQVLGLRARLAGEDGETRLTAILDGQPAGHWAASARDQLEPLLVEVDLARQADEHELIILHEGPGDLLLQDLVLRWRGAGQDPIGDELTIEEGRYWDEYIRIHLEVGDISIIDGAVKGTHPAFLELGVSAPDRRDVGREYGLWNHRETSFALAPFRERPRAWGLDIGCGAGQFTLQAARQGPRMVGIDLAAGLLKIAHDYAARQAGVRLDYVRAEGSRLPFLSGSFEVISAKESLHHVCDIQAAFAEIRRLLKEGGICVLMDHVRHSPFIDAIFARLRPPLCRRITRRFPPGPIPAIMRYSSPHEGAGSEGIAEAFAQSFKKRRQILRLTLVPMIWAHAWYAYGRLRWLFMPLWVSLAWVIEMANIIVAGPLGLGLRGEDKK